MFSCEVNLLFVATLIALHNAAKHTPSGRKARDLKRHRSRSRLWGKRFRQRRRQDVAVAAHRDVLAAVAKTLAPQPAAPSPHNTQQYQLQQKCQPFSSFVPRQKGTDRLEVWVVSMAGGEGFQHRCKSIHGRCDGDVLSPTLLKALSARHASSNVPHQPSLIPSNGGVER